jgi:hypothetical protein
MTLLTKNQWISVSFIAIFVPIGLLAAFKFTDLLTEPHHVATILLDSVSWSMERPSETITVGKSIENIYSNDGILVGMTTKIYEYRENPSSGPFFGRDGVALGVYITVTQGVIKEITVKFYPTDTNATLFISQNEWALILSNATVIRMKQVGERNSEAYISAIASNSPCSLKTLAYWVFNDENVEDHKLKGTYEIVYFNGSVYQKIVAPIILNVWPDAGNRFETAKAIDPGVYIGSLHWEVDPEDFYGIMVGEGQVIDVQMIPQTLEVYHPNYDLYLYDPNRTLRSNSSSRGTITERITFIADSTGIWYIQVKHSLENSERNQYLLDVDMSNYKSGEDQ